MSSNSQSARQQGGQAAPNTTQLQESLKKEQSRIFSQLLRFMKWSEEDMIMQIRKDLELVGFRCIFHHLCNLARKKEAIAVTANTPLAAQITSEIKQLQEQFTSMELRNNTECILKNLFFRDNKDDAKIKFIFDKYHDVTVSSYAYDIITIYLNKNAEQTDFCREVIQKSVKRRTGTGGITKNTIPSISESDYYFFQDEQAQEGREVNTDFLTPFSDINLFCKLEAVKKDTLKQNDVHVFQEACNYFEKNPVTQAAYEAKPKANLVYSVMEKSLMVNDFIERKNLENNKSHPNLLKFRLDDPCDQITCVEVSKGGNVILCGTQDSQIFLFDVSQFEECKLQTMESETKTHIMEEEIQIEKLSKIIEQPVKEEENEEAPLNAEQKQNKLKETSDVQDKSVHENSHYHHKFTNSANKDQMNSCKITMRAKFLGHEDAITSMSILYNEAYFVSSSIDLSIRLWDIKLNVCLHVYKAHLSTIWDVKFARQGYLFGSCSADRTAMLWTTNKPNVVKILIGHKKDVQQIEFSENLEHVLTASLDNSVKFWEIKSGQCMLTLELTSPVKAFHMSFSGYYLVTGQQNGDIRLWNLITKELIQCFQMQSQETREPINSVHISFDESIITVNSTKCLAYYSVNHIKHIKRDETSKDFQVTKDNNVKSLSAHDRFSQIEPKEIFEIPKIQTEKYLRSFMHMRNFIIAISKQSF